jgi:hypothetical protein
MTTARVTAFEVTLFCDGCGDERAFEQPPCADGHDVCPEWVCVACGAAVLLDPAGTGEQREDAGRPPTPAGHRPHAA